MFINAAGTLRVHCVEGITANAEVCRHYVDYSIGTVTALNPVIGYDRATELAAEAMKTGRGILELVREKKVLTEAQIAEVLDPVDDDRARPAPHEAAPRAPDRHARRWPSASGSRRRPRGLSRRPGVCSRSSRPRSSRWSSTRFRFSRPRSWRWPRPCSPALLPAERPTAGFANGTILLIVIAFLVARAVVKCGLGARAGHLMVSVFGRSTLGLSYSIFLVDARHRAGVSEQHRALRRALSAGVFAGRSRRRDAGDDPSRRRLGAFLMFSGIASLSLSSALWLTAMAANPLGAEIARTVRRGHRVRLAG